MTAARECTEALRAGHRQLRDPLVRLARHCELAARKTALDVDLDLLTGAVGTRERRG